MIEMTSNVNSSVFKEIEPIADSPKKFGTFVGVFIPCILMLFGVIIFLRLSWIVGLAGLSTTLVIITLATVIALITVISMSAIATNIEVKAGGVYYILSRSLGIEVGSAVGIPLYIKQSLTIAFCIIGFAESLKDIIPSWDITYISIGTLATLTFLAYTSLKGAMKVQLIIFIAIVASLASLFTGSEVTPMQPDSYVPAPLQSIGFWALFAIFFPAMTGVESSVSMSGDLRNPRKSLPIGTISAILAGFLLYVSIAIFLAYHVPKDRLINDPLIMQDLASVPSLIVLGIWGATLSSALGGLLAAPRTLKAIADDGIIPRIFGKTFGPMQEPRIATLATCLLTLTAVCFGTVNAIAPLLTMICLICYAVLNLSAGIETLIANPSWRPRVRIHWTISIGGSILCLIAMLMIAPADALISLLLVGLIYFFLKKRALQSSWVDIQQGILLYFSQFIMYRLAYGSSSSKSWRPHFLAFTECTEERSVPLLKFSEAISQGKGFLTMVSFIAPGSLSFQKQKELQKDLAIRFQTHKIKSFVKVNEAPTLTVGMKHMMEYYGLGPLVPNTILLGGIKIKDDGAEFIEVTQFAYERHYNVVIMNPSNHAIKAKNIHLWWDNSNPDNSNLMLVLAYMFQCNPEYKNKRIFVKAIVNYELEKKGKLEELEKMSIEKRLPIDVEVFVGSSEVQSRVNLIKEFSKDAEIVLMGLDTPPKQGQPVDRYIEYLNILSRAAEQLPSLVYVGSSETAPLEVVLQ